MSYYREGPFRPGGGGPQIRFGVPTMTPSVKAILIACAVVWMIQMVAGRAGLRVPVPFSAVALPIESLFGVVPELFFRGFLWQPVSYMFLHDPNSAMHILFNMLMVWMFGSELERFWSPRSFLRYYLVCGVGAGVLAALIGLFSGSGPGLSPPTIGASGAIFGIFTAYGIVFAERTILFMMIFPMKARTFAMIMGGLAFYNVLSQPGDSVSHIAHLGGALTGWLYLKRVWRIGEFYKNLRWKMMRRKFKVTPRNDDDWIH